jgi:DNA-binding transcriptional MocR family regulator
MYASIRDQLASEITAGVYPAGALLPSIREIMERWEVSTTTARKVLDELAAAGYARKEGTRGAISTGGPQPGPAPSAGEPARKAPPRAAVPGRLTVWPAHTIPAHGRRPDTDSGIAALDVRASNRPPTLPWPRSPTRRGR